MSKKSFPKRVRFFIADDIRAEGKKPMIIGLLTDDLVGIEIPAEHPEPSKEAPVILQSLAILTSFIDCKGPFEAKISLYQPNGTALIEQQKINGGIVDTDPVEGKNNINFIAKFMPFGVAEFGRYKFVIKLDKKAYEYEFEIVRRNS